MKYLIDYYMYLNACEIEPDFMPISLKDWYISSSPTPSSKYSQVIESLFNKYYYPKQEVNFFYE
ncbi:hypothetical protein [Ureaplasma urealyticum]|uniref:Uncharacterized protein n=1 Tax=Ureaplasma urealyticum TaxID=2130 RepID=A0ABD4SJ94_UREUR|nr:hypothetical protein [Ureaplasma urealyticum]MCF1348811.1 hypothetical protein [Ureaplasma urealyticum]MDU3864980.1 hypothetical protein [Ureaplasma urealyticum]QDI63509.1 hypothetical protein EPH05_00670 [Ureaplasma urealyticum]